MVGLVAGSVGLLVIVATSVLEARVEQFLWSKCRREDPLREMQQHISLGKSRIR
jgi:hypothetical protein